MRRALLLCTLLALPASGLCALPTGFSDELLTTTNSPVGLHALPDGRILATLRAGNLLVYTTDGNQAVIDTVDDVSTSGENGLLGVTAGPDWPTNPHVYYHYTRDTNEIIIERRTVTGDLYDGASTNLTVSDPYILLEVPSNGAYHNGGTVRFGPDGMLYVSIGDNNSACNAQNPASLQGVIMRLDVSGLPAGPGGPPARSALVPTDNPFALDPTDKALVFAYGLRNPYRFDIDQNTGEVFIADVGQNDWEELDVATGEENFGWPWREGPVSYNPTSCGGETGGLTEPIAVYEHNSGAANVIVGGLPYRPQGGPFDFPPLYDGVVFYNEIYSGEWRALQNLTGTWWPLPEVPGQPDSENWATNIAFVFDMILAPDGAVYYCTASGQLRRITYTGPTTGTPGGPALTLSPVPNPVRTGGGPVQFQFTGTTTLKDPCTIYNVQGRLIRRLAPSAAQTLTWDLRNAEGRAVSPGVYYYRFDRQPGGTGKITVLP